MKRGYTVFLILCVLLIGNLPANPLAIIYEEDSPSLAELNRISTAAGILPLSGAPPLTGYDLRHQIDILKDSSSLSPSLREALREMEKRLFPEEDIYIRGSVSLQPEVYANTDDQAEQWDWVHGYNDRKPILSLEAETIFADHIFGIITYGIEKRLDEEDFRGASISFPFLEDFSETNLQNSVPHTAYMAYASDHLTTVFGRDTLNWGNGNTGNLLIGNQAPYHDFVLMSASNEILRYSFLAVPMNELDADGMAVIPDDGEYWHTLFHGTNVRMAIAHRLEAVFSPRFRVSLTEWALHYTDRFDLRMFSPVMFLHNYQDFGEVNHAMNLEIESALARGLFLDFQFFLDQFQTAGELEAYEDAPPAAYAALLGIRYSKPTEQGFLSGYLEGVYTSPFVYLRAGDATNNYGVDPLTMYNLDFVHAVNMRYGDGSVNYLGYLYGPDAVVAAARVAYTRQGAFEVFGDLRFIAHGEKGIIAEDGDQSMAFGEDAMNTYSPSGDAAYTLIAGAGGSLSIPDIPVTLYGNTYIMHTWEDEGYSHDVQLSLGVRYTLNIL